MMIIKKKILKVPQKKIDYNNLYYVPISEGVNEQLTLDKYDVTELVSVDVELSILIESMDKTLADSDFIISGIAKSLIKIAVNGGYDFIIMPKGSSRFLFLLGRYWHGSFPVPIFPLNWL